MLAISLVELNLLPIKLFFYERALSIGLYSEPFPVMHVFVESAGNFVSSFLTVVLALRFVDAESSLLAAFCAVDP